MYLGEVIHRSGQPQRPPVADADEIQGSHLRLIAEKESQETPMDGRLEAEQAVLGRLQGLLALALDVSVERVAEHHGSLDKALASLELLEDGFRLSRAKTVGRHTTERQIEVVRARLGLAGDSHEPVPYGVLARRLGVSEGALHTGWSNTVQAYAAKLNKVSIYSDIVSRKTVRRAAARPRQPAGNKPAVRVSRPRLKKPGTQEMPRSSIDIYFREFAKTDLLTAEEEVALAKRIEAGEESRRQLEHQRGKLDQATIDILEASVKDGEAAAEHFVRANLRLVVSIAKNFGGRSGLEFEELIQEGNTGLIKAVKKFDYRRGFKFSTYATYWIRQAMQRGTANQESLIRVSAARHGQLVKYRAAASRLLHERGTEPTTEEIAAASNLTADEVKKLVEIERITRLGSLDRKVGFNPDSSEFGDLLAAEQPTPEDIVVSQDEAAWIRRLVQNDEVLDETHRLVLTRRFGLDGRPVSTLQELADRLRVSRETIRKYEVAALALLRSHVRKLSRRQA